MLQSAIMRITALCIWVPAVYLTYILVNEFTQGQSEVIVGLALMSILVCSLSLLHARYSWRRGDKIGTASSAVIYLIGAAVMLFLELGYWNATITGSHVESQRATAARAGIDVLMERDREAARTGKVAETSGEIKAKMEAQLAQPIGRATLGQITANCGDQTSAALRLCGEFFSLKAALAKAEAAEKVEQRVWSAGTHVEPTSGIKKDLFAGAVAVSGALGGSVNMWAAVFSSLLVGLLWATRDLSSLVAFGPRIQLGAVQEPQEARTAPETAPAPVAAPEPALPTVEAVSAAMKPKSPPPSNGGTRQAKPEPKPAPAPVDENKVVRIAERTERLPASAFFEEAAPPRKLRRGDRRHHPVGAAKAWLRDCTERTPDLAMTVSTQDAWDHYREWCESADLRILPRSRFERAVSAKVGSTSIRGQRCYIGLVLADLCVEEEKVRMLA